MEGEKNSVKLEMGKVGPEPPAWILCWDTLLEKKSEGEIEGEKN